MLGPDGLGAREHQGARERVLELAHVARPGVPLERDLVNHAIVKAGGNKAQAARLLGVTRRRMYSLLESSRKIERTPDDSGDE